MERVPLTKFATELGQHKTAELLGVRQSAISKAILKTKYFRYQKTRWNS